MRSGQIAGFLALSLVSASALAEVKHEGTWPSDEKNISLDLDHTPRKQALQKLAKEAGWSMIATGVDDEAVDMHIQDQPPSKVLDLLLAEGSYSANRDGTILSIRKLDVATPPPKVVEDVPVDATPAVGVDAAAKIRGEDRKITGANLRIEKGETVHDVSIFGGNLDVFGTVTGKISVTGGNVYLHKGSHVVGQVATLGGNIDVDDGAVVDGDVGVVGGNLHRGENSQIGGAIEVGERDDDDREDHHRGIIQRIGDALTRSALLFVYGAVLLTLMGRRMESLQEEVAARPMRSFALGILGVFGFVATIIALLITIVGIPVALAVIIGGALAMYASICAVLATAGRALLKHKTDSPYVHLALGCAIFLVLGNLPIVGGIVTMITGLIGIGTLVSTRIGGLWPGKKPNEGPYRTAA